MDLNELKRMADEIDEKLTPEQKLELTAALNELLETSSDSKE